MSKAAQNPLGSHYRFFWFNDIHCNSRVTMMGLGTINRKVEDIVIGPLVRSRHSL